MARKPPPAKPDPRPEHGALSFSAPCVLVFAGGPPRLVEDMRVRVEGSARNDGRVFRIVRTDQDGFTVEPREVADEAVGSAQLVVIDFEEIAA